MAEKTMTEEEYKRAMATGVFLERKVQQNAGDPIISDETPVSRLKRQGLPVPEELEKAYGS